MDRVSTICPSGDYRIKSNRDCLSCTDQITLQPITNDPVCLNTECYDLNSLRQYFATIPVPIDPRSRQPISDPDNLLPVTAPMLNLPPPHEVDGDSDPALEERIQGYINNSGMINSINDEIVGEMQADMNNVISGIEVQMNTDVEIMYHEALDLQRERLVELHSASSSLAERRARTPPRTNDITAAFRRQGDAAIDAWHAALSLRLAAARMLAARQRRNIVAMARGNADRLARPHERDPDAWAAGRRGDARNMASAVRRVSEVPEGFTAQPSQEVREAAEEAAREAEGMAAREVEALVSWDDISAVNAANHDVVLTRTAIAEAREAVDAANRTLIRTATYILYIGRERVLM